MPWTGTITDIIMEKHLKWLGHVVGMDEGHLPNQMMFGELRKTRPTHGTRKRWRDNVSQDLKLLDAKESWYNKCQDRKGWFTLCQEGIDKAAAKRGENRFAANMPRNGGYLHGCAWKNV
jgi:hypothetical protein